VESLSRKFRELEAEVDHFAVEKLPVGKFAVVILELPDHRCPQSSINVVAK